MKLFLYLVYSTVSGVTLKALGPGVVSLPACFNGSDGILKGNICNPNDPQQCDSCGTNGVCIHKNMTQNFCEDFCTSHGFQNFGLEHPNYCHCGRFDYIMNYAPINDSLCQHSCAGNKEQYCGGNGTIWISGTSTKITPKSETSTTLQPTTMSFDNKLEMLVNQSAMLDEATTLDHLVLLANDLYTLSNLRSSPKDVVKIIDNILEVDSKLQDDENRPQAVNTSARIIGALDNQITKTFAEESNFTVANNNNIVLKAVTFDKNFLTNDLQFSASADNLSLVFADAEPTNALVSGSIPKNILISKTDQSTSMLQVSFVVFHRSGLFFLDDNLKTNNSNQQTTIWRRVIGVKVEQIDTEKPLDNNVTYNFNNVKLMDKTCFKARCSYSDAISNVLREGCITSDRGNGDVSCSCNRLGHVALLLDPVQDNKLGREHVLALHFLSIILFGLSAILLIIILLAYLSNKLIRKRAQSKVLICLFFSLAVFDILYIVSNFSPSSLILCKAIGVALHYFLLASVMWMGGEVFTLYMNIVPKTIFDSDNQVFVKKVASVCFLLPIVPVIAGAVYVFKIECVNNEYQ
ncbi:adhesion G-protein coupled receptor G6-like [Anneissia japonica]|uniref:adhesion G-protein coupled receptor G6-like n=1 Tax=Anneissia japonica TaxID=1529436 RepID=UPI0014257A2A|nr:adhesion G-protein coupled receptor G6-like [Anneissia japonica]